MLEDSGLRQPGERPLLRGAVTGTRASADERCLVKPSTHRTRFALAILMCSAPPALLAQAAAGEARLNLFGGPVFRTGAPSRPMQLGLGAEAALVPIGSSGLVAGPAVEGGIFHPAISGKGNYYVSTGVQVGDATADGAAAQRTLHGFAVLGYTRFFNATDTGITPANAVNLGVGLDRWLTDELSVRVELREHFTPGIGHAVVLRIGIGAGWSTR
jgi:hypothetical protein